MLPNFQDTIPSYIKGILEQNRLINTAIKGVPKYYIDIASKPIPFMTKPILPTYFNDIFSKITLPNFISEAINNISFQHNKFTKIFEHYEKTFLYQNHLKHNWNGLFLAYNNSLLEIINSSIKKEDWNEIENVQEIEVAIADFPLQTNNEEDYYKQINLWFVNVINTLKEFGKKHAILMFLIVLLYNSWEQFKSTYGLYVDYHSQEQPNDINQITKDDIKSINETIESLKRDIATIGNKKIVKYSCKVYFKPNNNSKILDNLNENENVLILQTNHKWVLINYSKNNDDFCTGWILKKYLNK